MALEFAIRIGVHLDLDRLADAHVGQLRFLEVGDDPIPARHNGHERLAGLNIRALFHDAARDPAVFGRGDFGVGEIQFGLPESGFGLLHCGARGFNARLAQSHFRFGGFGLTARGFQIGAGRLRLGLRQRQTRFSRPRGFPRTHNA